MSSGSWDGRAGLHESWSGRFTDSIVTGTTLLKRQNTALRAVPRFYASLARRNLLLSHALFRVAVRTLCGSDTGPTSTAPHVGTLRSIGLANAVPQEPLPRRWFGHRSRSCAAKRPLLRLPVPQAVPGHRVAPYEGFGGFSSAGEFSSDRNSSSPFARHPANPIFSGTPLSRRF